MPLDTFICGTCQMSFNEIDSFIIHKKDCQANSSQLTDVIEANLPQHFPTGLYLVYWIMSILYKGSYLCM